MLGIREGNMWMLISFIGKENTWQEAGLEEQIKGLVLSMLTLQYLLDGYNCPLEF